MKQKELTKKQDELLNKLIAVIKELNDNNVGLIFDRADASVTAYNMDGIAQLEYDGGEPFDWDKAEILPDFCCETMDSNYENPYIVPNE